MAKLDFLFLLSDEILFLFFKENVIIGCVCTLFAWAGYWEKRGIREMGFSCLWIGLKDIPRSVGR